MGLDLDSHLGVHVTALRLREKRTELLATNLANADTPGFKARDLDFRAATVGRCGSCIFTRRPAGHADATLRHAGYQFGTGAGQH